jgi:tRNA dimethylallyltransferase
LPENDKNKRYVIRAIETSSTVVDKSKALIDNCFVVGIATDKSTLIKRIAQRIEQLFEYGVVDEAKTLGKKYGWDSEAMTSNIYRLLRMHIEDGMSLDDVKTKCMTIDWRLAKRQLTWLRRNTFIRWKSLDQAYDYIGSQLANTHKP